MSQINSILLEKFRQASLAAYPQLESEATFPAEITQSTQDKFGHYQYNSAMKLAKLLSEPPRKIAESILGQLDLNLDGQPLIAQTEIAGPGFINISLSPTYLEAAINSALHDSRLGIPLPPHKSRIIIDFCGPNTAKEMHVGHLRSTIIGDCLSRLFEFLGYDVLRLNHIGDWGTAFGMLIAYMKISASDVLEGKADSDLTHLVAWYRQSKKLFDEDPAFKKQAQQEVVALQSGNSASLKAWQIICRISREAYQQIYDLLDIKLVERGESFYNSMLPEIVADLDNRGLINISGGAKCIFVEGFYNREGAPLPLMVQKSDGGYNYDTTDMAAIHHRIFTEKGDRLIYVTDAGQATHFQLIFKAAEMAGYLDPNKVRVDHVPFGLVLGPDGKKFRTRAGETERLIDLLTNAIDYADNILKERSPELTDEARHELASSLGIGAIKYADLSCHRTSDYTFSYERMLRFEGNTAAYVMYSYVRVNGIKRKVNVAIEDITDTVQIELKHPAELSLALHLLQFDETLQQMTSDLAPHRLTDYLYTLAEKFNVFFRDCRVEGSPEQNSRLLLCEVVARTMKQGMVILGLPIVTRM